MSASFTVLLAEDDPVFRRVMIFTFERSNRSLHVEAVGDGISAYERIQQGGVDFLVTDQQMPGWTGLELLETLKQDLAIAPIPTILCTAKGFELDSQALRQSYGLVDVLHKPFSPRRLSKLVTQHLSENMAEKLAGNFLGNATDQPVRMMASHG